VALLLTGYNGFVGRHVLRTVVDRGADVVCLGRVAPAIDSHRVQFVRADLASGEGLEGALQYDIDRVVHLAASGVKASSRNWVECMRVNVGGMCNLLRLCERLPLTRLVATPTFYEDAVEQFPALLNDPYIGSKWAGTMFLKRWAAGRSMSVVLATVFQAFGADDDSANVLNYVSRCLREGRPAYLSSGRSFRDWIPVEDVAEAICVIEQENQPAGLKQYHIGSGVLVSIRDAAEALARLLSADPALLQFSSERDREDTDLRVCATAFPVGWRPNSRDFQASLKAVFASNL
jgi:nucleoside-diphosphate-sugar epimerase